MTASLRHHTLTAAPTAPGDGERVTPARLTKEHDKDRSRVTDRGRGVLSPAPWLGPAVSPATGRRHAWSRYHLSRTRARDQDQDRETKGEGGREGEREREREREREMPSHWKCIAGDGSTFASERALHHRVSSALSHRSCLTSGVSRRIVAALPHAIAH